MKILSRVVVLILAVFVWWSFSCSGNAKKSGLEDNLLAYNEIDLVQFTITGEAFCNECEEREIPVDMVQIEFFNKMHPLERKDLYTGGGLGRFTTKKLFGEVGDIYELQGTLYREGPAIALYGYTEVAVPDEDGDVAGVVLNFPSSEPSED